MPDAILSSAQSLVGDSLDDLRAAIDGLPLEALNWQPPGETNSIAVLATHVLGSTRFWLRTVADLPMVDRDRDAEFRASIDDVDAFRRLVDDISQQCRDALNRDVPDWSAPRDTHNTSGDGPTEVPAAYALIHAASHLRGHVDQLGLVRQLWLARA